MNLIFARLDDYFYDFTIKMAVPILYPFYIKNSHIAVVDFDSVRKFIKYIMLYLSSFSH